MAQTVRKLCFINQAQTFSGNDVRPTTFRATIDSQDQTVAEKDMKGLQLSHKFQCRSKIILGISIIYVM